MLVCSRAITLNSVRKLSQYDVVVVGGGLVGNAMACSLSKSSGLSAKRILLLEGGKTSSLQKSSPSVNYSNRVSAISPISVELFKKLNIWDRLVDYRVKKVNKLHVLDSCSMAELKFEPSNKGNEIAYIIENDVIIGALYDEIGRCNNIDVLSGTAVNDCSLPSDLLAPAKLVLSNGDTIETSLVIGADGANSKVRESMGVDYTSWNYEQSGLVATLNIKTGHNDIAWQRFTPLGPIALLPLSDSISSLVWTTTPEDAKRLKSIKEEEFIDELNYHLFSDELQNSFVNQSLFLLSRLCPIDTFRGSPPHVISLQSDTRAAFPLGFGHSHSYVAPRAALIGDAAHRVHPLAGQGVNLGWNDVQLLTGTLEKAEHNGSDLGSVTYLSEYDSMAQRHNVPIMVTIDWLNRLYRTDLEGIVLLRSMGLAAFNRLTPVKDMIVRQLSTS